MKTLNKKMRTPIEILNIVGAGGIDPGSAVEAWGANSAGKSTFCYETMEMQLEDKGENAMCLILDSECSFNPLRARSVFNIRPCNLPEGMVKDPDPRVFVEPAMTIEAVAKTIVTYIAKANSEKKQLLVIWDSVSVTGTEKDNAAFIEAIEKNKEVNTFSAGMMLRPRVIKEQLRNVMLSLYMTPHVILLINQAVVSIGQFISKDDSAGGHSLKHNMLYRLSFKKVGTIESEYKQPIATITNFEIVKSKNTPTLKKQEQLIWDTLGGKYDKRWGVFMEAEKMGIYKKDRTCKFSDEVIARYSTVKDIGDKKLEKTFMKNDEFFEICKKEITDYYRKTFFMVECEYKELEEDKEIQNLKK